MKVSRVHRLLKLITLLQSGTVMSAAQLAEELQISRRTLFRDLRLLDAAGIPYIHVPGKGYRIGPNFFLPPVNLKVTEVMGLMVLAKSAAAFGQQPLMAPAINAVRKLVAILPDTVRQVCHDMMTRVSVTPKNISVVHDDARHYAMIQQGIDQRRVLEMSYDSVHDGEVITTGLHPYHLHFAIRAWYVIGFSELHRQVRTFKLSRIRGLTLADRYFKIRHPFDIEQYLGKAWSLIREGRTYRVVLEFLPGVARNVADVRWHRTQCQKQLPNGHCIMQFEVDGLGEISWWLAGYGDQVIVHEPDELKQRLLQMHESAIEHLRSARELGPDEMPELNEAPGESAPCDPASESSLIDMIHEFSKAPAENN